jgi:hypothetical protein
MQNPAQARQAIEDELRLHGVEGYAVSATINDAGQTVARVRCPSGDLAEGLTSLILDAIEESTRDNQSLERVFELRGLRVR